MWISRSGSRPCPDHSRRLKPRRRAGHRETTLSCELAGLRDISAKGSLHLQLTFGSVKPLRDAMPLSSHPTLWATPLSTETAGLTTRLTPTGQDDDTWTQRVRSTSTIYLPRAHSSRFPWEYMARLTTPTTKLTSFLIPWISSPSMMALLFRYQLPLQRLRVLFRLRSPWLRVLFRIQTPGGGVAHHSALYRSVAAAPHGRTFQ